MSIFDNLPEDEPPDRGGLRVDPAEVALVVKQLKTRPGVKVSIDANQGFDRGESYAWAKQLRTVGCQAKRWQYKGDGRTAKFHVNAWWPLGAE